MAGLRYRIRCQAEKQGRRAAPQVEDMSGWSGTLEYVVHHRLENFVCLLAQQQLEDVEIFPIGTCRVAGPPEAQGNPGSRFSPACSSHSSRKAPLRRCSFFAVTFCSSKSESRRDPRRGRFLAPDAMRLSFPKPFLKVVPRIH